MMRQFTKMLRPLSRRLNRMVRRGVVTLVNDALKTQRLQVTLMADETADDVPHMQPYGFTTQPLVGAEVLVVSVGGHDSHPLALVVADRRYRFTGLAAGEVAMHDDSGTSIVFRQGGHIEVTAPGDITVNAQGAATVTAQGGVDLDGGTGTPVGVVQGDCVCAFTGAPHPQISSNVKGSL